MVVINLDTYFHIDSWKCSRCYKCIRLCMSGEDGCDYGLGALNIGYMGAPDYWYDNCSCHHCNKPVNDKGEYDEDGEMLHYPCEQICPENAIKIERW